jgi:two-component system cell cycle response regulator CpdR
VRNRSLLFVDDETALLALVADALEDMGFVVMKARTGAEALGMLATGTAFDFIVSDVSMPGGVSGIDLARRARELQPQARMILASGHPRAQLENFPAGVGFLAKPYRISQLLQMLDAA